MNIQLTPPLGTMAVIVDEESRTAEVLDVDRIALISIVINSVTGRSQFALAFGGADSNGKFRLDPSRAGDVAYVTIARENNPASFDALFSDKQGNPKTEFLEQFFVDLTRGALVQSAYTQWGAKYPNMQVSVDGELAFSAQNGVTIVAAKGPIQT